ncbi:MAG TPA: ROK family protein [Solirubrobacteraceae bacterium]|nr:ROK family protein [Solirubrobacteraceae bacterium]
MTDRAIAPELRSAEVVGVDLGGTKVAVARLSAGELSQPAIAPTELGRQERLIDQLVSMVQDCRGPRLDAVGIGVPSVVEFETGRVVASANIPLADVPLRRVLGERLGVPVFVDNDATVAALAEAHDERLAMTARDLVMFTIGTGVGGGLVLGGRIYRGATGAAGELGHTLVCADLRAPWPTGDPFPKPGSLERAASGHALDALARELARERPDGGLGRIVAAGGEVAGADAVACARAGDPHAAQIVSLWAGRLGIGIANAINTFDPDEVVIGGGGAQAGELLLEPARRVAQGYVLPGAGRRTTIRLARHGVQAGVLGAALLAAHELAGPGAGAAGSSAAEGSGAPGPSCAAGPSGAPAGAAG